MERDRTKPNHWTQVDRNPISPAAMDHVRDVLHSAYQGRFPDYRSVMAHFTTAKSVLDIGVVEHAREFIEREGWKHKVMKGFARRIVGCDILEEEVNYLRSKGFDVRLIDATSSTDLGERFEVAYIGDVIEHVNDASRLLSFAARHLEPNGKIVVTTPCPYWHKYVRACLAERPFIGNVDHVCWVTPFNALELANRASIKLDSFYLVQNLGGGPFSRLAHAIRTTIGLGHSELFSWAYVYVFTASDAVQ